MKPILSLLICLILHGCNFSEKQENSQDSLRKLNGAEVVAELENLEFFVYTDETEINEVKIAFQNSYTDLNFFQGKQRGESLEFMDNRYYLVDCEELFEAGGLTEYLDRVKISFQKQGLTLEYANEKNEQTDAGWTHTIELNGNEYVAFNGAFSDLDWVKAYVNFIEMLNAELKRQDSKERFYPIRCGNDGAMVLLTPEQFEFIRKTYPNDQEHPFSHIYLQNLTKSASLLNGR